MSLDFLALENMLAGEGDDEEDDEEEPSDQHARSSTQPHRGRFSRYIRSAVSRHRRRSEQQGLAVPPAPNVSPSN